MTSPSELQSWFDRKVGGRQLQLHETRTHTEQYIKIYGPRADFGVVTLTARPATNFQFRSEANWPAGNNFDDAVLDGILDAICCARYNAIVSGVDITLDAIKWHDVDSSGKAYYHAAKAATQAIIEGNTVLS